MPETKETIDGNEKQRKEAWADARKSEGTDG
jgi:hypothetical protein